MILLILCVLLLGLFDMLSTSNPRIPHELRCSVFLPIFFGVVGPMFFVMRLLSTRAFSKRFGVGAAVISTTGQAIVQLILLMSAFALFRQGFYDENNSFAMLV